MLKYFECVHFHCFQPVLHEWTLQVHSSRSYSSFVCILCLCADIFCVLTLIFPATTCNASCPFAHLLICPFAHLHTRNNSQRFIFHGLFIFHVLSRRSQFAHEVRWFPLIFMFTFFFELNATGGARIYQNSKVFMLRGVLFTKHSDLPCSVLTCWQAYVLHVLLPFCYSTQLSISLSQVAHNGLLASTTAYAQVCKSLPQGPPLWVAHRVRPSPLWPYFVCHPVDLNISICPMW